MGILWAHTGTIGCIALTTHPPTLHHAPFPSDQLSDENGQKNLELKLKEDEVAALKAEISRLGKLREGVQRKLRSVEEQKAEVESTRDALRQQIFSLERGKGIILCGTSGP